MIVPKEQELFNIAMQKYSDTNKFLRSNKTWNITKDKEKTNMTNQSSDETKFSIEKRYYYSFLSFMAKDLQKSSYNLSMFELVKNDMPFYIEYSTQDITFDRQQPTFKKILNLVKKFLIDNNLTINDLKMYVYGNDSKLRLIFPFTLNVPYKLRRQINNEVKIDDTPSLYLIPWNSHTQLCETCANHKTKKYQCITCMKSGVKMIGNSYKPLWIVNHNATINKQLTEQFVNDILSSLLLGSLLFMSDKVEKLILEEPSKKRKFVVPTYRIKVQISRKVDPKKKVTKQTQKKSRLH